jgi:hypothetical protein
MKAFKTKAATKNAIYKIVAPFTKGFFEDTDWKFVRDVWKALEFHGVTTVVEAGKYDGNKSKTWNFTAEVNGFTFNGYLVASFCGTVEDPTSRYDLCFII